VAVKKVSRFFIFIAVLSFNQTALPNFLDATFDPGTGAHNGFVESMAIQPDGKILICGNFASFNGQPGGYVARLNSNGSVDTNFVADVSYWTRCIAVQSDGKIVIGGFFNFVGGQSRNLIARLNANGSLDTTFDPGTGGTGILGAGIDGNADPFVFAIAIQPDKKILIGGNFASYGGVGRRGIARLNTNGVLDTTFAVGSGVNSWVRSLRVLTNEQILVSGWFTSYKDQSYNRMVRVNPDGSPDTNFNAYFGDQTAIYTTAPLLDGKMVVGGHTVNANSVFQQEIVRLHSNGSYDTNFNNGGSGANDKVESVALQSDGKIVMGGYFQSYNGAGDRNIARLNPDGTLDNSFTASVDSWIWTVLVQNDGKILICGGFNNVNGASRNGIARLNPSPSPTIFNARRFPDRFEVSVISRNEKNYSLQYKDSLVSSTWTSLPPVAGDGGVIILSDFNPSLTNRFYRVIEN
jgi:uncharacterized delta-60 repeat protein